MAWQDERSAWQPKMRVERDSATGLWRSTLSIHDQFRNVAGQWAEVDEDWADAGEAGFSDAALTMHQMGYLSAQDGTRRWYPRVGHLDQWVEFARPQYRSGGIWYNVPLGAPVRQGRTLTWDTAAFTFTLTAQWNALRLKVVLKGPQAAHPVRWPVSLHNLQWDNWAIKDGDTVVGRVRRPRIMWHDGVQLDGDGDPIDWNGRSLNVSYQAGYVGFTADLSGLSYPIEIWNTDFQPDEAASKDTWLDNQNQSTNQDTTNFKVRRGSKIFNPILEFDCSGIDGGDECVSAYLELVQVTTDDSGTTHYVYSIAAANALWVEDEACWDIPATGETWAGAEGCETSGTDFEADAMGSWETVGVTEHEQCTLTAARVEGWFGDPNTNYGILVRSGVNTLVNYADATQAESTDRPLLSVTHQAGGVAKNKTPLIVHLRKMMAA